MPDQDEEEVLASNVSCPTSPDSASSKEVANDMESGQLEHERLERGCQEGHEDVQEDTVDVVAEKGNYVDVEHGLEMETLSSMKTLAHEGKEIGELLMKKVKEREKGTSKEDAVKTFIQENERLGELTERFLFMQGLLCIIVQNKVKRNAAREGGVESEADKEGIIMGARFTQTFVVAETPEKVVEKWAAEFPAVQEVMREYVWFKPMIEILAYQLMIKVRANVQLRVVIGAVTSMTDLATDIYVTVEFWRGKKYGYFYASLASLLVSMIMQMYFVWSNYRPLGKIRAARECSWILVGLKPAVDAYNVASGKEWEVGTHFPPLQEMGTMKTTEMFAEAIPGVIIQLMAIITSKEGDNTLAWLSVAVSVFTTGFGSATVSYDYDTDPARRKETPNFYGFVPADAWKRLWVFVSMLLITSSMLMIKCMTIVLLGMVGRNWVFAFIGADQALYLLVKLLRNDFWYWLPVGGSAEILSSIIVRVSIKLVVDFTSLVQFRHPQEVGGAYWSFSFLVTMTSLSAAIKFYETNGGDDKIVQLAWTMAWIFIPLVLVSFAVLFYNMNRNYIRTFFSTQTGKGKNQDNFKNGPNDFIKLNIFWVTGHYWVGLEDEMKCFIEENWGKWEEKKPEWWTDALKATIPVEWIPTPECRNRESQRRASDSGRRPSLLQSMALDRVAPSGY
mmetsp:Transcript_15759/g.32362  ORF Transcript_15759/g.32362 Transcript_15759/m.32362 type:complete len:676 (+) Transcript_15759:137-2164(+)